MLDRSPLIVPVEVGKPRKHRNSSASSAQHPGLHVRAATLAAKGKHRILSDQSTVHLALSETVVLQTIPCSLRVRCEFTDHFILSSPSR